jgi:hypothetical protein
MGCIPSKTALSQAMSGKGNPAGKPKPAEKQPSTMMAANGIGDNPPPWLETRHAKLVVQDGKVDIKAPA